MSRRRVVRWAGIACIVAGIAVLGYVGWQLFGTNIVSERRQERLVQEVQERWRSAPEETATTSAEVDTLVRVPRFGDDYVMPVLEGVSDDALASGLAHFSESAAPGQPGNYALAGHRITHGEPLRDLPDLMPGDEVIVQTRDTIYTYVVDTRPEDLVVGFDDVWVVSDQPVNPDPEGVGPAQHQRLLTLTTCAELFHTDERMVVFGHLESTRPS